MPAPLCIVLVLSQQELFTVADQLWQAKLRGLLRA